jgi:hypothetical protein
MTRELWLAPTGALRLTYTPDGRQDTGPAAGCHAYSYSWPASADGNGANPFFPVILPGLPTSPAALEQAIEQRYADGKPDTTLFVAVTELLEESQTPSFRAALYRVVELLPGIENLGPMTDQLGRHGTAVGFTDSGTRYELIFNPATSAVLEARSVQMVRAQPVGATGYVVFVASGVVIPTPRPGRPPRAASWSEQVRGVSGGPACGDRHRWAWYPSTPTRPSQAPGTAKRRRPRGRAGG